MKNAAGYLLSGNSNAILSWRSPIESASQLRTFLEIANDAASSRAGMFGNSSPLSYYKGGLTDADKFYDFFKITFEPKHKKRKAEIIIFRREKNNNRRNSYLSFKGD